MFSSQITYRLILIIAWLFVSNLVAAQDCENLTISDGFPDIVNPTCGNENGKIVMKAGGEGTILYSLDNENYTTNSVFENLGEGFYSIYYKNETCSPKKIQIQLEGSTPIVLGEPRVVHASCSTNDDGRIIVNASGFALTYSLNDGPFTTNNTFEGLSKGTYTITVQDGNGCIKQQEVRVLRGTIEFGGNRDIETTSSNCSASEGTVTVTAQSTNNAPIQYTLIHKQNGNRFTNQAGRFTGLAPGDYTLELENRGCLLTSNVTVGGIISSTISSKTDSDCAIDNGSFTLETQQFGNYEFKIDGRSWQDNNQFLNLAPGPYQVLIRNKQTGCVDSQTRVIIGLNTSISAFDATSEMTSCAVNNGSIEVTANSDWPITYYLYNELQEPIDSNKTGLFNQLAKGNYFVSTKDENLCETGLKSIAVEEDNDITSISEPQTTVSDCLSPTGTVTVMARADSGIKEYTLDGTKQSQNGVFSNVEAGEHIITVTSWAGCEQTVHVEVPEQNDINIREVYPDSPSFRCSSDGSISLVVDGSNVEVGLAENNENFAPVNDDGRFVFKGLTASRYTIVMKNSIGCTKTLNVELTSGFSVLNILHQPTTCYQRNGVIEVLATGNGLEYRLDDGEYQDENRFEGVSTGIHTITVRDENDCIITRKDTVKNQGNLQITKREVRPTSCGEDNGIVSFQAVSDHKKVTYRVDNGRYRERGFFTDLPAGEHLLFAKNGFGCVDSVEVNVPASSQPSLSFDTKPAVCGKNTGQINVKPNGGVGQLLYSMDGGEFQNRTLFQNLRPGDYVIAAKDEVGCPVTDTVTIVNDCRPLVPTSFAPNQNGKNDRLKLVYPEPLEIHQFQVFNSWGEKVYEAYDFLSTDQNMWWNGGDSPNGTYVVHLTYLLNEEMVNYSSTVHLLR